MILQSTQSPLRIVFAAPPDRPFFAELWNESAQVAAARLGFDITLVEENAEAAAGRWPDLLAGADALITTWLSPRLDETILRRCPALRIVGHAAGSVADYITPELFAAGVKVTGANDLMAAAVADWCLAMTLIGLRRFPDYAAFGGRTELRWNRKDRGIFIRNAKIGICGFGTIASRLVEMLAPLKPNEILVHSRHLSKADALRAGMRKAELPELLAEADVVLTLGALTAETTGMIGSRELAMLRDGTTLINAGRGRLIDEPALCRELATGRINAILDVFHEEPLPTDSPLLRLPNVILTPHNAGRPSRSGYITLILEEFRRFFDGAALLHEITRERAGQMTVNLNRSALTTAAGGAEK